MFNTKLANELSKQLVSDEKLSDVGISVVDRNGVVTLTGTVSETSMKQHAEALVASHDNVMSVINDIAIDLDKDPAKLIAPMAVDSGRVF